MFWGVFFVFVLKKLFRYDINIKRPVLSVLCVRLFVNIIFIFKTENKKLGGGNFKQQSIIFMLGIYYHLLPKYVTNKA